MKYFIHVILASLLSIAITQCDFSNTNIDPNQISEVALEELLPAALTQSAFNSSTIGPRIVAHFMQQLTSYDVSNIAWANYVLPPSSLNDYWKEGAYGGVMNMSYKIIEKAESENQLQYAAVGKILMAKELGTLASSFGDVPYSKAFNSEILKSAYDSQEEIYGQIQLLLDEAIEILELPGLEPLQGDLIFNGALENWAQTAHAFKARYYMHLTKRDAEASSKAIREIQLAFGHSNDQPDFNFGTEEESANPYALFGTQRPASQIIVTQFRNLMELKSDPRQPKYMEYNGSEWFFFSLSGNLFWTRNDSPLPLISYTELKFLMTEALLLNGSTHGRIENSLKAAVQSNMDYLGVNTTLATSYITVNVNFAGLSTEAELLEKIMKEKYFAFFAQATIETWVDYRRTGYPKLTPNPHGVNGINPSGQIPQRFIYTQNEYLTNQENVEAAVENIGGDDFLDTKLWSFK